MKADAISIVEAAYDCEQDVRAWLGALLERAAPKLDRGFGIGISMYEPGVAADRTPTLSLQMDEKVYSAIMSMGAAHPEVFHRCNTSSAPLGTITNILGMASDEARLWPPFVKYMHPFGITDVAGALARDPSGTAVIFTAPMPDLRRSHAARGVDLGPNRDTHQRRGSPPPGLSWRPNRRPV